jgi:hypothetical protein
VSMWGEIEAARRSWDVVCHPLVRSWGDEPPGPAELSVYAAAHSQALRAVGDGIERLGRSGAIHDDGRLIEAARRERALAAVWQALESEAGGMEPTQAIEECAAVWSGREAPGLLEELVILHAVALARAELAGRLAEMVDPGAARSCLGAEIELSLAHAELTRELADGLGRRPGSAGRAELVSHVEAACSVHWDLLDAIEVAVDEGVLAHA